MESKIMTFDYITYQDDVTAIREKVSEKQEAYNNARIMQARSEWAIDNILVRRINDYIREKSNIGIRMVILMAMADPKNPERESLKKAHQSYIDSLAQVDINRMEIEGLKSDLIAIQSLIKYQQEGERYLAL